jgi:capsid protein
VVDASGRPVESFEPGMIMRAVGARDVRFHQPTTNPDYAGYNRTELFGIAAGACVTYELLTADFSNVNFSAYRAGLNDLHEMIGQIQWLTFIPQWCETTWQWFIDAAFLAGRISRRHYGVEWEPPKFSSPDPLKDFLTDLGEVRAGFQSHPQAVARRGYNAAETLKEQKEWLAKVDAAGLVFDSDPRRVTKTGVASGVNVGSDAERAVQAALDLLEAEGDPDASVLRALFDGRGPRSS